MKVMLNYRNSHNNNLYWIKGKIISEDDKYLVVLCNDEEVKIKKSLITKREEINEKEDFVEYPQYLNNVITSQDQSRDYINIIKYNLSDSRNPVFNVITSGKILNENDESISITNHLGKKTLLKKHIKNYYII